MQNYKKKMSDIFFRFNIQDDDINIYLLSDVGDDLELIMFKSD